MKDRIEKWLNEQGYPLEFQVANELKSKGFNVTQSDYYKDSETNEYREIDVIGYKQEMIDDILFRITFVIECKAGRDKPWLLFSSDSAKLSSSAGVDQTPGTLLGRDFLSLASKTPEFQNLELFSIGDRPVFGITQCFTNGKDIPYQAISSVSKAAFSFCKIESEFQKPFVCDIIIPFVIILAPMYESYYSSDIQLEEIDSGIMTWRNPIVMLPHSIIKIQKLEAFKRLLHVYNQDVDSIFTYTKSTDILREARKKYARRNSVGKY